MPNQEKANRKVRIAAGFVIPTAKEERNIWYRGRKDANGNLEYDCYMESLKVIPCEKASRGKNLLDFPM